eukprot:PITA_25977
MEKYKAWLVEKGSSQARGIDFGDIFSPVAKVTSIRLLLFVVVGFDFEVEQMDVKTTFLHEDLEEEIYMKQPKGFAVKDKKELVWKLKKSLYGLKQSPRMWYQKFDVFIWALGFTRSKENHCVYFKLIGERVIYLVLYVDDMLLVGNDKGIIHELKTQLSSKFDMKDLGAANYILGVRLSAEQCPKTQEEEEDMSHVPYESAISSLMYEMVYTRPNIAHVVGVLSRFMSKPGKEHWTVVKQVFRYLRGTSDYDWAEDLDQRRSTSGSLFNLFGAVNWMSKKQSVVVLSTTEVEYMAATHASKEVVWL